MPVIDIILSQKVLFAMVVFIGLSIMTEIVGRKILLLLEDTGASEWIFEHIFIPLARAIGLMIFILLSYPILFGIHEAPALSELLFSGSGRINTLMNVIFVLPLLFSLIPILGNIPALILPIQAIAGASLIFSWMQAAISNQSVHYFPKFSVFLIIVLLAILSHGIALWASHLASSFVNRKLYIDDGQKIIYRIVILAIQLPVILIYMRGLGMQLLI